MRDFQRSWIEISEKALFNNIAIFDQICHGRVWMPVIKSSAYGHGMEEILSLILKKPHLKWLGVNEIKEAAFIRSCGYSGDILICGPLFEEELEEAARLKAHIFVGSKSLLKAWLSMNQKPFIHLKIDTGLSRQGFLPEELKKELANLTAYKNRIAGLCSHFANVEDVTDFSYANFQLSELAKTVSYLDEFGLEPTFQHVASSASSLIMPSSRLDLCRVGISFYGLWPSELTRLSYSTAYKTHLGITPVLSWRCRIAAVKQIPEGAFIGYGCTVRASKPMSVAILPVGYAEGYPRLAGQASAYVLIGQKRCSILGRICMNMMIVDVSQVADCQEGQIATLIGKDGLETLRVEQIASWSQSINYEITTRINPSLKRIIVTEEKVL